MATIPGGLGAPGTVGGGEDTSDSDSSSVDRFYEAEEVGGSDHETGRQTSLPSSTPSFSQDADDAEAAEAASDIVVEDLQGLRPRAKTSPDSVPWGESWDEEGPAGRDRCGGMCISFVVTLLL